MSIVCTSILLQQVRTCVFLTIKKGGWEEGWAEGPAERTENTYAYDTQRFDPSFNGGLASQGTISLIRRSDGKRGRDRENRGALINPGRPTGEAVCN